MKEPIGGLVSSREVTAEYRPTMTDLEQAIYAAVYGAMMARDLDGTIRWKLQTASGDDAQENLDGWMRHRAQRAKDDARRAVELHRGGE